MKVTSLVLYMALAFGANAALADSAQIADLRDGDMRKLVVHSEPRAVSDTPFNAEDGGQMSLGDFKGKVVAVNFWAVWCAPCRHEMPMLSDLQTELGGDDFEVVTIAMGRNAPQAMVQFFGEIGVENLPLHADPRMGHGSRERTAPGSEHRTRSSESLERLVAQQAQHRCATRYVTQAVAA